MARTTGTYTAPSPNSWNPAVSGEAADYTDWNQVLDDIEAALTESVYTAGLGATANLLTRTATTDTKKLSVTGLSAGTTGNDISIPGRTIQPWVSLTCVNGANTDLVLPEGTNFYITGPTGVFTISGLTQGVDGRLIRLYNSVAFALTITNDATSTAANRFMTLTGADITTTTQGAFSFVYSSTASRWIQVSNQA
jgi:hypothetical protein